MNLDLTDVDPLIQDHDDLTELIEGLQAALKGTEARAADYKAQTMRLTTALAYLLASVQKTAPPIMATTILAQCPPLPKEDADVAISVLQRLRPGALVGASTVIATLDALHTLVDAIDYYPAGTLCSNDFDGCACQDEDEDDPDAVEQDCTQIERCPCCHFWACVGDGIDHEDCALENAALFLKARGHAV